MGVKGLRFLISCWTLRDHVCSVIVREGLAVANIIDFEKYRRQWKG
jgi:hypothetical protein